jgi:hypothetical protein
MAGKTAKANSKRKAKYGAHPAIALGNKRRRQEQYVLELENKLKHFARRVAAGKMTQHALDNASVRIRKEIAFTLGEAERPKHVTGREAQLWRVKQQKQQTEEAAA